MALFPVYLLPLFILALWAKSQGSTTIGSPSSIPIPVNSYAGYQLLGCYTELNASQSNDGDRAVGLAGEYYSPPFGSPNNLTVPMCLDGCNNVLAPNGAKGYLYAAVESSRECFCGLTLSNLSTPVVAGYCSSRCTGDPSSSCGGSGYLLLYRLRSSPSTPTSSTSSLTPTITPSPKKKMLSTAAMWGIITMCIILFFIFIALLIILLKHRHDSGKRPQVNLLGFIGGNAPKQEQPLSRQKSKRSPNTTEDERNFRSGISYRAPEPEIKGDGTAKENRETSGTWKRGFVPPGSPEDIKGSVEMGDFVSDVSRGDLESGKEGYTVSSGKPMFKYPNGEIAELSGEEVNTPSLKGIILLRMSLQAEFPPGEWKVHFWELMMARRGNWRRMIKSSMIKS